MNLKYQTADKSDLKAMKALLLEHGPNEWNYLPEHGIDAEFLLISEDKASAILAVEHENIVGFAISIPGSYRPEYLSKYCNLSETMFIGDVVVDKNCVGQGIGSNLLRLSIESAKKCNVKSVLIQRHEENLASAGMMKNAGFKVVDTYHDPEKRFSGSKKTSILKYEI